MGVITILCPKTGRQTSTGIEIDRAGFKAMPVVQSVTHCWECGTDHIWSKRWALFVEAESAQNRNRQRNVFASPA